MSEFRIFCIVFVAWTLALIVLRDMGWLVFNYDPAASIVGFSLLAGFGWIAFLGGRRSK